MQDFDNNFGAILRFDISILPGTFKDIFATTMGATDCSQFLHRPEGITWGPAKGLYKEKLLYVTGYTDVEQNTPSVNNEVGAPSLLQSLKHVQRSNLDPNYLCMFSHACIGPFNKRIMSIKLVKPTQHAVLLGSTMPCGLCLRSLTTQRLLVRMTLLPLRRHIACSCRL